MKNLILLIIFFVSYHYVYSQRVGLVLSGGGAKGIAHVGVLKALEENNIPVDYIAGTSIGAIVGGMYAAGYTPDEMYQIFSSDQFQLWANGILSKNEIYFFKRKDDIPDWLQVKLLHDTSWRASIPTHLVPNHQMDLAFLKIFTGADARAGYNFDSLFVPFRCVSTDIHAKEAYVFKSGELSQAVRASMTFPFYFKPISVDGKLMFDGGMQNNFPDNVMQSDFQPDITLGVRVANNAKIPEEGDLVGQLMNMFLAKITTTYEANKGLLLEPQIKHTNLMEFDKYEYLYNAGYKCAIENMTKIKALIKRRISNEELQKKRTDFKRKIPELKFKEIQFYGLNSTQRAYAQHIMHQHDTILSFSEVKNQYFRLLADEIIGSIYPIAHYNPETSFYDLSMKVHRENMAKLYFGGLLSSSSLNNMFAQLEINHIQYIAYKLTVNTYFGRFYNSAQIRLRADIPARIPYYLDLALTTNRLNYFKGSSDVFFDDSRPTYLIDNDANLNFDIGFATGQHSKFVIGGNITQMLEEYYQTTIFQKADTADKSYFNFASFIMKYERNTLNHRQFANEGSLFHLGLQYVNGKETHEPGSTSSVRTKTDKTKEYLTYSMRYEKYFKLHKKLRIGTLVNVVFSETPFFKNYISTIMFCPSFQPTPHSQTQFLENYRADKFAALGFMPILSIKKFDLRLEAFAFLPYKKIVADENLLAKYEKKFSQMQYIFSSSLVFQSPIGPFSLTLNYYEREKLNKKLYLTLNFGYILFNKRGLIN